MTQDGPKKWITEKLIDQADDLLLPAPNAEPHGASDIAPDDDFAPLPQELEPLGDPTEEREAFEALLKLFADTPDDEAQVTILSAEEFADDSVDLLSPDIEDQPQ